MLPIWRDGSFDAKQPRFRRKFGGSDLKLESVVPVERHCLGFILTESFLYELIHALLIPANFVGVPIGRVAPDEVWVIPAARGLLNLAFSNLGGGMEMEDCPSIRRNEEIGDGAFKRRISNLMSSSAKLDFLFPWGAGREHFSASIIPPSIAREYKKGLGTCQG